MKIRIAQWVLSQVLPPDRAASTVGDWIEDLDKRGSLWFWSCVIRTAISRIWSDLTESPLTMARWGLTGFAMNVLVPLGLFAVISILDVFGPGRGIDIRYRHDWVYTYFLTNTQKNHALPPNFELTWLVQLSFYVLWVSMRFQTGRWIARRVPSREVAGCAAISLVGWTAIVVLEVLWHQGSIPVTPSPHIVPTGIANDLILLAGALWLRRRQLRPVG